MIEIDETLSDVYETARAISEYYPELTDERKLAFAIGVVQANAFQNINRNLEFGLVVAPKQPSALEAIAMTLGYSVKIKEDKI